MTFQSSLSSSSSHMWTFVRSWVCDNYLSLEHAFKSFCCFSHCVRHLWWQKLSFDMLRFPKTLQGRLLCHKWQLIVHSQVSALLCNSIPSCQANVLKAKSFKMQTWKIHLCLLLYLRLFNFQRLEMKTRWSKKKNYVKHLNINISIRFDAHNSYWFFPRKVVDFWESFSVCLFKKLFASRNCRRFRRCMR